VAEPLFGQCADVQKRSPSSIGVGARTARTRSAAADPVAPRPRRSVVAITSDPIEGSKQVDLGIGLLKSELALWRAFLGEEIDAILYDKD
jgi:hypothetical protein